MKGLLYVNKLGYNIYYICNFCGAHVVLLRNVYQGPRQECIISPKFKSKLRKLRNRLQWNILHSSWSRWYLFVCQHSSVSMLLVLVLKWLTKLTKGLLTVLTLARKTRNCFKVITTIIYLWNTFHKRSHCSLSQCKFINLFPCIIFSLIPRQNPLSTFCTALALDQNISSPHIGKATILGRWTCMCIIRAFLFLNVLSY